MLLQEEIILIASHTFDAEAPGQVFNEICSAVLNPCPVNEGEEEILNVHLSHMHFILEGPV